MSKTATNHLMRAVGIIFALFLVSALCLSSQGNTASAAQLTSNSSQALTTQSEKAKVSVDYQVRMKDKGWSEALANNAVAGTTGEARALTGFLINVKPGNYTATVKYRIHRSNGTWSKWKKNGTELKSKLLIDAVQIKLSGSLANDYDIVYKAHVQDLGWQRPMHNGESAGAEGLNKRIEAIQIALIPKSARTGWVRNSDLSWSYYQNGQPLANQWIVVDEHPIDTMMSGLQRYWLAADGKLAVGRYVVPNQYLDSNAGWTAYATPQGFVARGKYWAPEGLLLAKENGQLYTKTRWLTTKLFDEKKQKYRLVKNGVAAVVKTGLFKVGKKQYYAWEDGRGHLLRSNIWFVANKWYKADKNGVLKKYTGKKTKLIDRYVKWAIKIAKDNSHGYSQVNRWGPDYDCSSFVCSSLLNTGFQTSGATWTGNMKACLKKSGFKWHRGTTGLRRGDIVLAHNNQNQHVEIYLGDNKLVGAHCSETGGIDGQTGDQTSREISVTSYYNMPWDGYLRYVG